MMYSQPFRAKIHFQFLPLHYLSLMEPESSPKAAFGAGMLFQAPRAGSFHDVARPLSSSFLPSAVK